MICIYDRDVEMLDLIICGPGKDDELDERHRKDEGEQRAVAENADKVLIMYGGKLMEKGKTEEIFTSPRHPYTRALLAAIPSMNMEKGERLKPIEGNPPSLLEKTGRCPFYDRCKERLPICEKEMPEWKTVSSTAQYFCHRDD